MTSKSTPTPRPETTIDRRRVRGLGGVRIILGRELSTKFLTKAFVLSTLIFAAISLVMPLTLGDGGDDDATRLGHTAAGSDVAEVIASVGGDSVEVSEVDDAASGEEALADGDLDAVLVPGKGHGYRVLVEDSLDPQLGTLIQSTLHDQALRQVALDNGASNDQLDQAALAAVAEVVPVGAGSDGIGGLMVGLGFAIAAAVVVLLWGIPLATDVMQEKASRVVEILLTSVRPWQLLAGKVLATAIIGMTQLVVVLAATWTGLRLSGSAFDAGDLSLTQAITGLACVTLGIITCSTLMAGLAARVERQEDLSSVLQPAMGVTLVPVVAAIYGAFEFPDSVWFDIASVAPVFNTFVMPARMSVEAVPAWQLVLAIAVAVATTVACFAAAGRVYSGAVLRSGGRVGLLDAFRSH